MHEIHEIGTAIKELIAGKDNICILGAAGTGKSTLVNSLLSTFEHMIGCSPTGIAAVNIKSRTINSLFGFYDAKSLYANIKKGIVERKVDKLRASGIRAILIDEIAMLSAQVLDLIYFVINNSPKQQRNHIKLILVGDPGQLPPVEGNPFFQAQCMKEFTHINLSKIYRQTDIDFVEVLNKVRVGEAKEAYDFLSSKNCFASTVDESFYGPTIFSTNNNVDSFNLKKVKEIGSIPVVFNREEKGNVPKEWLSTIPKSVIIKEGSKVMITKNNPGIGVVNGDVGRVEVLLSEGAVINIARLNKSVVILKEEMTFTEAEKNGKKLTGAIKFLPLALAYASTIHKAQGSTYHSLQIDLRGSFIGRLSGGLYTALSRCTNVENLRLVGSKEQFMRSCYISEPYLKYINDGFSR